MPALKDITVNGYNFAKGANFPTTGFKGATFTLNIENGSASDYTWEADASWVSVTDGVVKFTGKGTRDKVTITGTPTSGQGNIIKYSFTLKSWFINSGTQRKDWTDANTYCSLRSGYRLPTVAEMTLHSNYTAAKHRGTGALWNEWGELSTYSGAGFVGYYGWSSEQASSGNHYSVGLSGGYVFTESDSIKNYAVCRLGL